jgi:N-acyl-L-homoserine lactone synthetase
MTAINYLKLRKIIFVDKLTWGHKCMWTNT